ncbi:MAG: hypothetical protein ACXADA_13835 [Candidatus Hodarchaeales archaeon]|jgi:hypothetical protein
MSSKSSAAGAARKARTTRARRHRSQRRVRKDSLADEDIQDSEKRKKLTDASTRMYYTKVITGGAAGIIIGIFFTLLNDPSGTPTGIHSLWWIFPVLALCIAMFIVRFVWKFPREEIDHKRLVLSGTFSLVAINVFSTGLTWMILSEITKPGFLQNVINLV